MWQFCNVMLLQTQWFLDVLSLVFLALHGFSQVVVQEISLKLKFNLGSKGPKASALFSRFIAAMCLI